MSFKNREEAGKQLAKKLEAYKGKKEVLILGLARGGVVTAHQVSEILDLPLDVICPRKVSAPMNPEYAIGAVTESGEGVFNDREIAHLHISQEYLKRAIQEETEEARRRAKKFRKGKPPLNVKNKTAIVIDDGMATGLTMMAAVQSLKKLGAEKVIVAIPVAPMESVIKLKQIADEVICLETPLLFYAVGQFYEEFEQTTTEEVAKFLHY